MSESEVATTQEAPEVRTHLRRSVLIATLFFLPVGLVAIYFSWSSGRALVGGDLAKAARHSRIAKRLGTIALALGIVIYLILIVALLALGAFSA